MRLENLFRVDNVGKESELPTKSEAIIDELARLQRLEEQGIKTEHLQEILWESLQARIDEMIDQEKKRPKTR